MKLNQIELAPLAPLDTMGCKDVFVPEKVCAKQIHFAVEEGRLAHLRFVGGCDGNLKAISTLLEGMEVDDVVNRLSGITCGKKDTSCVDQLSRALAGYKASQS